MSLVSGCLPKDFSLSLARPRAPLLCSLRKSCQPLARRLTPPHPISLGGREEALSPSAPSPDERQMLFTPGGCSTLDLAVARGEVPGDTPKCGGGGGVAKVRDPGWVRGMLWRCELPGKKTPSPHHTSKDCALGLPREETGAKEGVYLSPSPFPPASVRK